MANKTLGEMTERDILDMANKILQQSGGREGALSGGMTGARPNITSFGGDSKKEDKAVKKAAKDAEEAFNKQRKVVLRHIGDGEVARKETKKMAKAFNNMSTAAQLQYQHQMAAAVAYHKAKENSEERKKQQKIATSKTAAAVEAVRRFDNKLGESVDAMDDVYFKLNQGAGQAFAGLVQSMIEGIPGLGWLAKGFNMIADQAKKLAAVYEDAASSGVDMRDKHVLAYQAAINGIGTADLGAASKEFRNLEFASGGLGKMMDTIGGTARSYDDGLRSLHGSQEAATKSTIKMYGQMSKLGIYMENGLPKETQGLYEDLYKLGMSADEATDMVTGMTETGIQRSKLIAGKDRQSIMNNILARQREYVALGMTTEQAKKAGEALDEIQGKKATDRFEQAAKMQAAMGAMGIQGGGRAAEIIRMGKRAGASEQGELRGMMEQMERSMVGAETGSIGQEFAFQGIMEGTGLDALRQTMETMVPLQKRVLEEQLAARTLAKDDEIAQGVLAVKSGIDIANKFLEIGATAGVGLYQHETKSKGGLFGGLLNSLTELTGGKFQSEEPNHTTPYEVTSKAIQSVEQHADADTKKDYYALLDTLNEKDKDALRKTTSTAQSDANIENILKLMLEQAMKGNYTAEELAKIEKAGQRLDKLHPE
jgi:hypothetical protein